MAPKKGSSSSSSGGIGGWLKLFAIILGVLSPIIYLIDQNLDRFYIFEPVNLHDVAKRAIAAHGNDTQSVVHFILKELQENPKTAPYVNDNIDNEYFFNNAGGAMGGMTIIHASVTEYLIIFGTAVGTEGHSGRHTADDYFHILRGEQWAYVPGEFEREVYKQGDVHLMRKGVIKQYRMPELCFALEYARGWIPPMMFFGYADLFTSVLDLPTAWYTAYYTGKQMIGNLLIGKF